MRSSGQLDWLLDDLVGRVAKVTKAVVLSRDGLPVGSSQSMTREDTEYLCAAAAAFQSLAKGTSQQPALNCRPGGASQACPAWPANGGGLRGRPRTELAGVGEMLEVEVG